MSRERPYVSRCSDALKERLAAAGRARLFVVQTNGPTSFVLREDGSRKTTRVSIGSVHSCTCGAREQPCLHVAFVMLRVFRLQPNDQRCWQSSLIDRELEALVEMRARAAYAARREALAFGAPPDVGDDDGADVPRRPYADDADPCPICYEELCEEDEANNELDWCRKACGKSVHRRCFAMWAEHQASIGKPLTCPHCRSNWGSDPLPPPPVSTTSSQRREPGAGGGGRNGAGGNGAGGGNGTNGSSGGPPGSAPRQATHRDARCKSCRCMPIIGNRYRCLVCTERTELCQGCYSSCMHPHHPFAVKERPIAAKWQVAPCRAVEAAAAADQQSSSGSNGGNGGGIQDMRAYTGPHGGLVDAMPQQQQQQQPDIGEALASLQHREITPEDYDLLLALSSGVDALPGRNNIASAPSSRPSYDRPLGGGGGSHNQPSHRHSANSFIQNQAASVDVPASRLVWYDAEEVAPLVDELNEAEASVVAARKAAMEAQAPPSLIAGTGMTIGSRPDSNSNSSATGSLRATGTRMRGFGSSGARPWQDQRHNGIANADRIAAERMAASSGAGFQGLGLSGTGLGLGLQCEPCSGNGGGSLASTTVQPPIERSSSAAAATSNSNTRPRSGRPLRTSAAAVAKNSSNNGGGGGGGSGNTIENGRRRGLERSRSGGNHGGFVADTHERASEPMIDLSISSREAEVSSHANNNGIGSSNGRGGGGGPLAAMRVPTQRQVSAPSSATSSRRQPPMSNSNGRGSTNSLRNGGGGGPPAQEPPAVSGDIGLTAVGLGGTSGTQSLSGPSPNPNARGVANGGGHRARGRSGLREQAAAAAPASDLPAMLTGTMWSGNEQPPIMSHYSGGAPAAADPSPSPQAPRAPPPSRGVGLMPMSP